MRLGCPECNQVYIDGVKIDIDKWKEREEENANLKKENAKLREAIEATLRIKTMWLVPTPGDGPEAEEECKALLAMLDKLEQALKE